MSKEFDVPRVGVATFIFREGKTLLGKRLSPHGKGFWSVPGGHLEAGETIEECAKREVLEETNLHIHNIKRSLYTNDLFQESKKHYITCFTLAESVEESPKVMEPEKCECWQWFDLDNLPSPLFLPIQQLFKATTLRKLYSQFFRSEKIAYLACPFAHKDKDIMKLRLDIVTKVSAKLHEEGRFVFSPLTHNNPLIDLGVEQSWEKWQSFDLSMLMKCDALYVLKLEGWQESKGVQHEIKTALTYGLPILELEYDMDNHQLKSLEESDLISR